MDDLKNNINNKLKLLEKLIIENKNNNNLEEIEKTKIELDELLDKYMEDFD